MVGLIKENKAAFHVERVNLKKLKVVKGRKQIQL